MQFPGIIQQLLYRFQVVGYRRTAAVHQAVYFREDGIGARIIPHPVSYTHLTTPVEAENKTKVLTVDVNGQPYRVTVAYGAVDPATLTAPSGAVPAQAAPAPVGEGKDVLSPLEGKFFLVKNAQETPKKVGEKVNKGDVICYVEAMKTYNAIRAEYDGTITAICANSGDTVSEDDVLMKIV